MLTLLAHVRLLSALFSRNNLHIGKDSQFWHVFWMHGSRLEDSASCVCSLTRCHGHRTNISLQWKAWAAKLCLQVMRSCLIYTPWQWGAAPRSIQTRRKYAPALLSNFVAKRISMQSCCGLKYPFDFGKSHWEHFEYEARTHLIAPKTRRFW